MVAIAVHLKNRCDGLTGYDAAVFGRCGVNVIRFKKKKKF